MAVKITECPRDAMQGLERFISTHKKIEYLESLLQAGFDVVDCGSFVSPKAIPQMADSSEVLKAVSNAQTQSKLSVVVANARGARDAAQHANIDYIGFPFSISETFQLKNTNSSIDQSMNRVEEILAICKEHNKQPLIYISMAFGNPYGDEWSTEIAARWVKELAQRDVTRFSLADTVGVAVEDDIESIFKSLISNYPTVEFSAHLHTHPGNWHSKVSAAYQGGCRHFESAMLGFGGCPMAGNDLVGNLATANLLEFLNEQNEDHSIKVDKLKPANQLAQEVFQV